MKPSRSERFDLNTNTMFFLPRFPFVRQLTYNELNDDNLQRFRERHIALFALIFFLFSRSICRTWRNLLWKHNLRTTWILEYCRIAFYRKIDLDSLFNLIVIDFEFPKKNYLRMYRDWFCVRSRVRTRPSIALCAKNCAKKQRWNLNLVQLKIIIDESYV